MSVRTEGPIEYRGYEITLTEWCGMWQPRPWPLAPWLPHASDGQVVTAAAPSLEAALERVRVLIDRMLNHPPSADHPLPRPLPSPEHKSSE